MYIVLLYGRGDSTIVSFHRTLSSCTKWLFMSNKKIVKHLVFSLVRCPAVMVLLLGANIHKCELLTDGE